MLALLALGCATALVAAASTAAFAWFARIVGVDIAAVGVAAIATLSARLTSLLAVLVLVLISALVLILVLVRMAWLVWPLFRVHACWRALAALPGVLVLVWVGIRVCPGATIST